MNFIIIVIDTDKQMLEYINAGHPPGLLVHDDRSPLQLKHGGPATGISELLEQTAMPKMETLLERLLDATSLPNDALPQFLLQQSEHDIDNLTDDVCLISITLT